jgi:phage antirepressor YoqD-like protein
MKSNNRFSVLHFLNSVKPKVTYYTEQLTAEETILAENAAKAIAMKEELVPV